MGKLAKRQENEGVRRLYQIPIWLLVMLTVAAILDAGGLATLARLKTFDLYQQLRPRPVAQDRSAVQVPVVTVDIDPQTRAQYGQWPWPRTRLAELVIRLQDMGAEVIVLDMIFDRQDQTSPEQMLETWWGRPGIEGLVEQLSQLPDHDAVLAQAFARGNVVTSFALTDTANNKTPHSKAKLDYDGTIGALGIAKYSGAIANFPPLPQASTGNGHSNLTASADGVSRHIPILARLGNRIYPNQILEALRVAQGLSTYEVVTTPLGGRELLRAVKIGAFEIPVTDDGHMRVYAAADAPGPRITAQSILNEQVDASDIRDAIVIIGASADDFSQQTKSPQGHDVLPMDVKASALRQILNGQFLSRPDWALWAELAYLFVIGIGVIALALWVGIKWSVLASLAGMVAFAYGSWVLFGDRGWLMDSSLPLAGIALGSVSASLIALYRDEAEKTYVRKAYGDYLTPSVVNELSQSKTRLKSAGETRDATIMYCNVRGLTSIEDAFSDSPSELVSLVSDFLNDMTTHIQDSQGTVNRHVGDNIMAVWNAPLDDKDHARHACDCALQMLESLDKLNDRLESAAIRNSVPFQPIHLRIGINTGKCIAGIMGSKLRNDYSVLGEPVRTAERLHTYSEYYGPAIIIGEQTYMSIHHYFAMLEIDLIEIQGRPDPYRVFALIGNPVMKANPQFRALEEAHEAIFMALRDRLWDDALDLVSETRELSGAPPRLYDLYEKRLIYNQQKPPPPDWNGAYESPIG